MAFKTRKKRNQTSSSRTLDVEDDVTIKTQLEGAQDGEENDYEHPVEELDDLKSHQNLKRRKTGVGATDAHTDRGTDMKEKDSVDDYLSGKSFRKFVPEQEEVNKDKRTAATQKASLLHDRILSALEEGAEDDDSSKQKPGHKVLKRDQTDAMYTLPEHLVGKERKSPKNVIDPKDPNRMVPKELLRKVPEVQFGPQQGKS
eukprot:Clim_evm64s144 gene=Clim_evmTU64s144